MPNLPTRPRLLAAAALLAALLLAPACSNDDQDDTQQLTIYSGRGQSLVGQLIEQFEDDTGIRVRVRYAGTAELAAAILEEGQRSPADIFYAQDAGALAALAENDALRQLPNDIVQQVPQQLRDASGRWIGTSGRARVLVASTERVRIPPDSIFDLTNQRWRGRVGWAPANGSFQAFITAMRQLHGEERTQLWLQAMLDNDVREYPNNSSQVQAVGDGELDIGLVNHYYLFRFLAQDPDFPARNHFTDPGAAGSLINIAGVAMLNASDNIEPARRFIQYLLSQPAQEYFRDQTSEYPLSANVPARPELIPLDQLDPPSLALTSLADLNGTLALLREVGAIP